MKKLIDDFLIYLNFNRGLSSASQKSYQSDLDLFNLFLKQQNIINILKVNKNIILLYLKRLQKNHYSEKSVARKISAIKMFFKFLMKEHFVETNPTLFIQHPKSAKKLPSTLSIEEVNTLINTTTETTFTPLTIRNTAIIELLYSCGLRVSELVNLSEKDISLERNTIRVTGKGQKERIIPFGKIALLKIKNYIESSRPQLNKNLNSAFFLGKGGKNISRQQIWNIIQKKMSQCKINKKISPHTLRHSFATHLLNNGTPIYIIQKLLGHQDINATEIYTHLSTNDLQQTYKKFHPRS